MEPNLKLSKHSGTVLAASEITAYRRLVGRLLYLQISRPDICFAVHCLSQFLQQPTDEHLNAVHHLLRYLKRSPGQGVILKVSSTFQFKAFVDAEWGTCPDTRRSVTGFCVFLGDSLISWKSKKQPTVSRSSAEAEYRGLASVTSEVLWLTQLLNDLHVPLLSPTLVYCDNQGAIAIASNPTFHERTKHVEIDCHFVRDKIVDGFLKLLPICLNFQLADIFTEALPFPALQSFLVKLGVFDAHNTN